MSIYDFLQRVREKDKGACTHTSVSGGKYTITGKNMEDFWSLYCEQCHDVRLCITEKPTSVIPVLCDVDIKIDVALLDDPSQPLYTEDMVIGLVQVYKDVLTSIVKDLEASDFVCCVLEKEPYMLHKNQKTYKKNGFHLHFPQLFLSRYAQETELLPRIIQEVKARNVCDPKSIDHSYCKGTPWLLYGSSKSSNPHDACFFPYEMSYCFDWDMNKVHYRQALGEYHVYNTVSKERLVFTSDDVDFYLPRILSILPTHRAEYEYELRTDIVSMTDMKKLKPKTIMPSFPTCSMEDYELVQKLVDIISPHRAEDRNEWIQVGWILYNIFDGDRRGYDMWTGFSKTCPAKFDEKQSLYEWNRMTKRRLTVASLKFLARQDNPDKYSEIMALCMEPYIYKTIELNGSHNDLAKALFQKYEFEFVCSSIQFKTWYQFDDHIWKRLEEGITLRQKISEEIVQSYFRILDDLNANMKKFHADGDDRAEERVSRQVKVVMSLISKLKSAPYKNNIMREAQEVFFSDVFMKQLDSNPYLIAFQNGVYDLQAHTFRNGHPADYISLKMPIAYNYTYSITHPDVVNVQDFLTKIFPDRALREYFLNLSSEIFVGGNQSKVFQIWTGDGDNGKSVTQTLFEKMLGSYSIKLPTSLITGKRTQSSSACPELARAGNGVRLAMLQEPDQKDTINIGVLKELSGNDTFFARGLYKEGQEITPMFKLVLICNDPPKLPYNDRATWNRIRVIPFESTFTDDAPESPEEQLVQKKFPKDKHFAQKIPDMIEAFAWLLLHYLKHRPACLNEPHKVLFATSQYKNKNDVYKQFIEDFIVPAPQGKVFLAELYSIFKDWYRDSFPHHGSMPNKIDIKDYFTRLWGDMEKNILWRGYEIRDACELSQSNHNSTDTTATPLPL
jgi:P4 family phage/plasmid primase-like protien